MSTLNLKPTHTPVKAYYDTLEKFGRGKFDNEGNIRGAFEDLLKKCARQFGWMLVPEYRIPRKGRNPASIDGALLDDFNIARGFWKLRISTHANNVCCHATPTFPPMLSRISRAGICASSLGSTL